MAAQRNAYISMVLLLAIVSLIVGATAASRPERSRQRA